MENLIEIILLIFTGFIIYIVHIYLSKKRGEYNESIYESSDNDMLIIAIMICFTTMWVCFFIASIIDICIY